MTSTKPMPVADGERLVEEHCSERHSDHRIGESDDPGACGTDFVDQSEEDHERQSGADQRQTEQGRYCVDAGRFVRQSCGGYGRVDHGHDAERHGDDSERRHICQPAIS